MLLERTRTALGRRSGFRPARAASQSSPRFAYGHAHTTMTTAFAAPSTLICQAPTPRSASTCALATTFHSRLPRSRKGSHCTSSSITVSSPTCSRRRKLPTHNSRSQTPPHEFSTTRAAPRLLSRSMRASLASLPALSLRTKSRMERRLKPRSCMARRKRAPLRRARLLIVRRRCGYCRVRSEPYSGACGRIATLAHLAVIPAEKLVRYALDPAHPRGCHKARVFSAALDIGREDWRYLREQLYGGVLDAPVRGMRITRSVFCTTWSCWSTA